MLRFTQGKIHKNSDVISDFAVLCSDGEHFFSMDKDGQRPGWTTFMGPDAFRLNVEVIGENSRCCDDQCQKRQH